MYLDILEELLENQPSYTKMRIKGIFPRSVILRRRIRNTALMIKIIPSD